MARSVSPKTVQCYLCGHRFEVSGRAQSTSCSGCNRPVFVADEVVKAGQRRGPIRELRTCGKVTVARRGRLICDVIEAHGGVDCQGIVDAKKVLCGRTLTIGAKAQFKGDVQAPAVVMEEGARVAPSLFAVPSDPRGLSSLDKGAPHPSGGAGGESNASAGDKKTGGDTSATAYYQRGRRPGGAGPVTRRKVEPPGGPPSKASDGPKPGHKPGGKPNDTSGGKPADPKDPGDAPSDGSEPGDA
ncbi:MAG: polymer-forming cytoskeletal protein [Planctomycetota bacterium]